MTALQILLIMMIPGVLHGQNDDQYNYRDQCRSIIVGHYWKVVDSMNTNQQFYLRQIDNVKKMKSESKKLKAKLSKLQKTKSQKPYDTKRDQQMKANRAKIEFLDKTITSSEAKIPQYKKKYDELVLSYTTLRERMEKVFKIEDDTSKKRGKYPKSIQYKTACPKYRHVCPLPEKERNDLLKIFKHEPVPNPCLKYSYIR